MIPTGQTGFGEQEADVTDTTRKGEGNDQEPFFTHDPNLRVLAGKAAFIQVIAQPGFQLKKKTLEGAEINDAKKTLATEATALLHGRAAAESAAKTAQETFEKGALGGDLPTINLTADEIAAGAAMIDQFLAAGLCASKGEARRHIKAGALKVNDEPVREERPLRDEDIRSGTVKLSIGKKKHAIIRVS